MDSTTWWLALALLLIAEGVGPLLFPERWRQMMRLLQAQPEQVLRQTGSRSRLVFLPLPPDDPRQRQPDISMARHELGWQPGVALEDGLKETIACFARRLAQA